MNAADSSHPGVISPSTAIDMQQHKPFHPIPRAPSTNRPSRSCAVRSYPRNPRSASASLGSRFFAHRSLSHWAGTKQTNLEVRDPLPILGNGAVCAREQTSDY